MDICADFSQSRGAVDSAKQALNEAKLQLTSAEKELQAAKAAADASWNPFGAAKKAYKAATQQYQQAQSQFSDAQKGVRASQESQLKKSAVANGDVELSERINKRQQLSSMMGTLRTIQDASARAESAQGRANTSRIVANVNAQTVAQSLPASLHGAPNNINAIIAQNASSSLATNLIAAQNFRAQAAEHHSTMVQLANQFNQQAESVGVPTFNSTSAEGISQELDGMTRKVSAALQDTMKQLDADYQALATSCR